MHRRAAIGGTLYSDCLTKENGEAPSYIEMVRHNISTIVSALANRPAHAGFLEGRKQGN
jgi:ABC-type Zn uptake system ZnuABC Zn-binding protein ZnuA